MTEQWYKVTYVYPVKYFSYDIIRYHSIEIIILHGHLFAKEIFVVAYKGMNKTNVHDQIWKEKGSKNIK